MIDRQQPITSVLPSVERIQQELARAKSIDDFFGKEGIFARLFAGTLEQMLEAELTAHLGYPRHAPAPAAKVIATHFIVTQWLVGSHTLTTREETSRICQGSDASMIANGRRRLDVQDCVPSIGWSDPSTTIAAITRRHSGVSSEGGHL